MIVTSMILILIVNTSEVGKHQRSDLEEMLVDDHIPEEGMLALQVVVIGIVQRVVHHIRWGVLLHDMVLVEVHDRQNDQMAGRLVALAGVIGKICAEVALSRRLLKRHRVELRACAQLRLLHRQYWHKECKLFLGLS